ncbi:MAG: bifunctional (p)ppGpp synthetase/guanosine-3',5'-bis(diphosphate) 3'-pyrophosphohydrolase [Gammaproteobacteria bacterium]|nr:bifunctional (p)ppGpp synthetase/guanosine-3',5'-bis(diphosphate) 3'-pyrophosphohydrolase [Gammaproteobacteria bacterium]
MLQQVTAPLRLEVWLEDRADAYDPMQADLLKKACLTPWAAEQGDDSQPVDLARPLEIADILRELGMNVSTQLAAILEARGATSDAALSKAERTFGADVVALVAGVHRMNLFEAYRLASPGGRYDPDQAERVRKLLLSFVEDPRVVVIKLAKRVCTLHEAKDAAPALQRRLGNETQEIYAPLASRLGIWQLKWELEDYAFRFLEPATYRRIAALLAERREDRERYIENVVTELQGCLARVGIEGTVTGRPKHIYSIWRKMQAKGLGFNDVIDVRAARILVESIPDCYAALGAVHTKWQHIPREFDDYIANPKGNYYRSLHTAVFGPNGRPLEVQIRTLEMHEHAELGVAAHWRYKESGGSDDGRIDQKVAWLRQVLEWKDESTLPDGLLPRFQSDRAEERIYVVSPKGKVVDLPTGATPLDFAYRIHTDVGHRCRAAKVDGTVVPLTYPLTTGQQVEILTARHGGPSRDWLNSDLGYITTGRARARVRQWFRSQGRDASIAEGRDILAREMRRLGVQSASGLQARFELSDESELLAAIGYSDISVREIASALEEDLRTREQAERDDEERDMALRIDGLGSLPPQFAQCCNPLSSDSIVGYITRAKGVTVHRRDCPNALRFERHERNRLIELGWTRQPTRTYAVEVEVSAFDRKGLLRDIVTVVANDRVNVTAINSETDEKTRMVRMNLTLEIEDLGELSRVLHRVGHVRNVFDATRSAVPKVLAADT